MKELTPLENELVEVLERIRKQMRDTGVCYFFPEIREVLAKAKGEPA